MRSMNVVSAAFQVACRAGRRVASCSQAAAPARTFSTRGAHAVAAPSYPVDLSTTLAGKRLPAAVGNSPNPLATSLEHLEAIAKGGAAMVTTRTSLEDGFEHDDAVHKWAVTSPLKSGPSSVNCLGYSPLNFEQYLAMLPALKSTNTPVSVSITGSESQLQVMVSRLRALAEADPAKAPDFVEVNLSCPNIPNAPPISYTEDLLRGYLSAVLPPSAKYAKVPLPVGIKVAPCFTDPQFNTLADLLNEFKPQFVTAVNTVGAGLIVDIEAEASLLDPMLYGGLGGAAIHSLALGNVHRLRQRLDEDIDIVAVGGCHSGATAFDFFLCGASVVQLASALLHEGPQCFQRIHSELADIMSRKGYTSIEDFRGKLKTPAQP